MAVTCVVAASCGGFVDAHVVAGESNGGGDPSDWIGAASWVVGAEVVSHTTDGDPLDELELAIRDVVFAQDEYYWLARFPVPELEAGSRLRVELAEPSQSVDLTGHEVFIALQASGTPDELRAGTREDGALAYSAILVFDRDWNLVEAGGGHFDTFTEILAEYEPVDRSAVLALIADARVTHEHDNEWAIGVIESDETEEAPERARERPQTPGPLGEWRRARGFEEPSAGVPDHAP